MAVNQDAIGIRTGISEKAAARAREHKFFLTAAIMFPVIVIIGFSKNYYFRPFFPAMGPMYSDLVRVHAVIMTMWILLFATQAWLVSSKRVNLHMKLGMAGVGLAVLVVVSGYLVSIGAIAHQTAADRGGIPPLVFLVVPIADLVLFVVFFGGAIYLRKRSSAEHKRLMILSALNFLPPATARFPVPALLALGPIWIFGVPIVLTIAALAYDTWRNRKVNKVFLAGSILLIASFPARMWVGGTEMWLSFAEWLTR
jgi:hypothetical protein